MKWKSTLVVLVVALLVGGAGYAGYRYVRSRGQQECAACKRPVHETSRTVALVNGKQTSYCCPMCALSEHRQSGAKVEVTTLTDFLTGARLEPARAVLVRGSSVNPCAEHHQAAAVAPDKHPMEAHFDRCAPSLLAFASEAEARGFMREHGGRIVPFSALAADYR